MIRPRVLILGGGPAGVGAAYRLRTQDRADVTVVESRASVGGNAGSFSIGEQRVDFGSHRLHPSCEPHILADIRRLMDGDLLRRPRHGRIRLCGRWIHFPLKPVDMLLHVDKRFALGAARDAAVRAVHTPAPNPHPSFASELEATLGPTICNQFYFPYARKIWGRDPRLLSPIQARRRVSANSFGKLIRKVLPKRPSGNTDKGFFYYPRRGYGQISEAYADAAHAAGARLLLGSTATKLTMPGESGPWKAVVVAKEGETALEADYVWSTIPLGILARVLEPSPPEPVIDASNALKLRSMLLIYLRLPVNQFTQYDAHYFPGTDVRITRLSEPKNYVGMETPVGSTVLCAELPCSTDDDVWTMSDVELARLVRDDLRRAGIPLPVDPEEVVVKRLSHAYPIYETGFERHFGTLDEWVATLPRFLSYGRQGLFAHDNTHHALSMAYAAVDCLADGAFDNARWADYRVEFEKHVVED